MTQDNRSRHDHDVLAETNKDASMGDEPHREGARLIEPDNIRQPPLESAPGPQIITTDTARQAPAGFPVLYVLVISVVAAALALGLYTIFWTRTL
ncbi:MAG: hypothetical protein ACRCVA_11985 [Phreatobacter sp.]